MSILFTSDLHLGHKHILPSRPEFYDIEEHDDEIISRWNAKVNATDIVYILGDLSFRSSYSVSYYLSQMKGKKHLVVGNHDISWMRHTDVQKYFESVDYLKTIKLEKKQITLCHYPMLEWPGSRYADSETSFLIHGHIHGEKNNEVFNHIRMYQPHALNAGVDVNGYEPVTFEELRQNNKFWYNR